VLLDNFVAASARLEAKEIEQKIKEQKALRQFKNPLEPLVARHVAKIKIVVAIMMLLTLNIKILNTSCSKQIFFML
jgi:hypothetical protein